MNVRKSDNSTEEFSVDKVKRGVCEAYGSVGEECPEALIDSLSKNLYIYENIQTSEIRRQVEECLMSINKKVAKAYIAKNEERDANGKLLKNKNDFITNYINASNASTGSKFDPNANVTNKNIATLNAEIPKQGNIQFNRYNTSNKIAKLYSKKLAQQYIKDLNSHIIYKNDESSFGINSPYCVAIQSYPFLVDGLKGLGGLSTAPKNIDSFCGMFVNLVFAVSSQFAGAVAIAGTFNMFDYYARKEWGDDYYLNDDKPARIKYGKDKEESISISKQIEQYFQQIVYSINQPAAARGFQSA